MTVKNNIIWADTRKTVVIVLCVTEHKRNIIVSLKLDSPTVFGKNKNRRAMFILENEFLNEPDYIQELVDLIRSGEHREDCGGANQLS